MNLNLDDASGILDIPPGHVLLVTFPNLLTAPVAGGVNHTISVYKLHLIALSLSHRNPLTVPNPLDDIVVGNHRLELGATIRILGVAVQAGFTAVFPAVNLHYNFCETMRMALQWGSSNTAVTDIVTAAD